MIETLVNFINAISQFYDFKTNKFNSRLFSGELERLGSLANHMGLKYNGALTEIDRKWLIIAIDNQMNRLIESNSITKLELQYIGGKWNKYLNQIEKALWLKYNPETIITISSRQIRYSGVLKMMSVFAHEGDRSIIAQIDPEYPNRIIFDIGS